MGECWSGSDGTPGTATFMIMGDTCTRTCGFCDVATGGGDPLDEDEPTNVASAVAEIGLDYVVITSVDRDDLPDQGSGHFAETIRSVRDAHPDVLIEVLIPDFRGEDELIDHIIDARPDVIAHNVETVNRLQSTVRDPRAGYQQSLGVLERVKNQSDIHTKSSNIPQPDWNDVADLVRTHYGPSLVANGQAQITDDGEDESGGERTLAGVVVPSDPNRAPENVRSYLTTEQYRLYDLIWRRLVATQATEAILETVSVTMEAESEASGTRYIFVAQAGIAEKWGFLEIYPEVAPDVRANNAAGGALLQLSEGETLQPSAIAPVERNELCEKCGRPMVIKLGRFGKFIACSGFPDCRNSKPLLVKVGVDCPECGEGEVVERRSKKGRPFYGCSRYPECEFISWAKPVGRSCSECGDILVEAGKRGGVKCRACNYKESADVAKAS